MTELSENNMKKDYSFGDIERDLSAGRDLPPGVKEEKERFGREVGSLLASVRPALDSLGREVGKLLRPLAQSTREFMSYYAEHCDKPEYILTMALADREDSHALKEAVRIFLGRLARQDAFITEAVVVKDAKARVGQSESDVKLPRLVILGADTISYQEILELEHLPPELRRRFDSTVIGDLTLAEIYADLIAVVVKDAKARVGQSESDEIKRQGHRYSEIELTEDAGSINADFDISSITEREDIREKLEDIKSKALAEGYRADRIQNTLKVARYGMKHGTFSGADEFLKMHRDTVTERRKDLLYLLSERG
jgi:hypothetical protein